MALQNLEFKQKVSGDYIHYESEPVQLTGDCGIQLLFKGDKNDVTVLSGMDGENFAGSHYEFNQQACPRHNSRYVHQDKHQ